MAKDSLFPSDEPTGYRVWHRQGDRYACVAHVESNALGAMMMTTHGFMGYERWQDNPAVTAMPGEHRSTTIGDVLVGRDGQPLEISTEGGLGLKPVAPGLLETKGHSPAAASRIPLPDSADRAPYQQHDPARGPKR